MEKYKTVLKCPFCCNEVSVWETGFGVVSVAECKVCEIRYVMPHGRKGKELHDWWLNHTTKKECDPFEFMKNKSLLAIMNGYD